MKCFLFIPLSALLLTVLCPLCWLFICPSSCRSASSWPFTAQHKHNPVQKTQDAAWQIETSVAVLKGWRSWRLFFFFNPLSVHFMYIYNNSTNKIVFSCEKADCSLTSNGSTAHSFSLSFFKNHPHYEGPVEKHFGKDLYFNHKSYCNLSRYNVTTSDLHFASMQQTVESVQGFLCRPLIFHIAESNRLQTAGRKVGKERIFFSVDATAAWN